MRRVLGNDLADDKPVKEHPDGGEVLFDAGLGKYRAELLYISGDVDRLDLFEQEFFLRTPF